MRAWFYLLMAGLLLWANVASAQIRRPLVFIPGILGTKLCDEQNALVWGGLGSLGNFGRLDLSPGGPGEKLQPCGLITRIVSLGPFWQADIYTPLLQDLEKIGYTSANLFLYGYDWRQSNAATADALAAFIREQPGLQGREFDILAHSMGGLVARLLIQRHPELARSVKRVITLGTPFQGAARSLEVIAKGWGPVPNFLAGRLPTIRRTALSFPSLYELFPNYQFGRACCRMGSFGDPNAAQFDIFDFALWERNGWAADLYTTQQDRAYLKDNLEKARSVSAAVHDRPRDAPAELHFIGTRRDTPYYLYVDPQFSSLDRWQFATGPGDSVVPAWSAADALLNSLAGTRPAFPPHATIFTDDNLQESLKLELTESPAPRKNVETIARTSQGNKALERVDVSLDRYFLDHSGDSVVVRITIQFAERLGQAELALRARQADDETTTITLRDVTTQQQREADTVVAEGSLAIHGEPSPKRVDIDIPGVGVQSAYVEIAE